MHISQLKSKLRQSIDERIKRMKELDRHAEGRTLGRVLLQNLPPAPLTLTIYFPLKTEPNLQPLILELIERGDRVFLPCFENKKMVFREAVNLTDLIKGEFMIPEPPKNAPLLNPDNLDIALVPGRAFDKLGNRLGRGNGGFDKWISDQRATNTETQFWGTCLECQIVGEVPVEEHDEKVDVVVTARGLIQCNDKAQ